MNRYNNEVGFHSPSMTEQCLTYIRNRTELDWTDSSWHNDLCDSIEHTIVDNDDEHKFVSIMLPNSFIDDDSNELFNTFSINDEEQNNLLITKDINEVIDFINKNYNK